MQTHRDELAVVTEDQLVSLREEVKDMKIDVKIIGWMVFVLLLSNLIILWTK